MPFARDQYPKQIAERLIELATKLKTRTRANLTDANHSLETVMQRFFNALYGWQLVNLNAGHNNYPAADLGDRRRKLAVQITNEKTSSKIADTADTALKHGLNTEFERLMIFFLLEKKPAMPKNFAQPLGGPSIDCIDITDLLTQMRHMNELGALKCAAEVLEEELSAGIGATPLHRYFQALSENFSTYENLGLPPPANAEGEKDTPLSIRNLFVEPTCTKSRVSPEEFDADLIAGKNPAEPLLPLLAGAETCAGAARRTVLLADPGMGKSTLIQWLIATLASKAHLPLAAESLRGAIPLPFILRDLVSHLPKEIARWDWSELLSAFRKYHPRSAGRPPLAAALTSDEALFRSIIDSERAFFLIDGLDEISNPEHRRALRNALWEGFDKHRTARWLVTSRVVGYDQAVVDSVKVERAGNRKFTAEDADELRKILVAARISEEPWMFMDYTPGIESSLEKKFARLLYLAPFDDDQQLTFARNWYIPRLGDVPGSERSIGFVKAVREHPSIRVIGRVPNLLYLLALLYRHKAHLPNGRALVYAAISEAYLEGIDLDRHLNGHPTVSYKLSEKVRFLAIVARHMQERRVSKANNEGEHEKGSEILVTRKELEQWLAPYFPGEEGCETLHAFLHYVAARSGLLLPRGEGLFGFAHLSFQEYYAACWLEDEFRRLLNAKARGTSSSFLSQAAKPKASGALTRQRFAAIAAQPSWRESMIFLVEKLSANADDTQTLISWLFPQLLKPKSKAKPNIMPGQAAHLLTALSLDPQVALAVEQRRYIWEKLWSQQLSQPSEAYLHYEGGYVKHFAQELLAASEFQAQVWEVLVSLQPVTFFLNGCGGVTNLKPLIALPGLRELFLVDCAGVTDLAPLAGLVELQRLHLNHCKSFVDLRPLAGLTQLKQLWLYGCSGIVDLAPLAGLLELRKLSLQDCTNVKDFSLISKFARLKLLFLGGTSIADLSPLASLAELEDLILEGSTGVTDLTPIGGLPRLRNLYIKNCNGLSADTVAAFCRGHPDIDVSDL